MADDRVLNWEFGIRNAEFTKQISWEAGRLRSSKLKAWNRRLLKAEDRVLNSEIGIRNAERKKEKLGDWEDEKLKAEMKRKRPRAWRGGG